MKRRNRCPHSFRQRHSETHQGARSVECGILIPEPTLAAPFTGDRMARREYQNPKVKLQKGPRPHWYIRYRVWVYVDRNEKKRIEKRHVLGYCDQVTTKKEAERLKGEIMRTVNRQVYAIESHIPFERVVDRYRQNHFPTLALSAREKYGCHLHNHILPALPPENSRTLTPKVFKSF
jgi:hypothetical protein